MIDKNIKINHTVVNDSINKYRMLMLIMVL